MLVRSLLICVPAFSASAADPSRIQITLDSSEADQVLAILALRRDNKPIEEAQWQNLFATEPYQRLKQREKKIGEQFHEPRVAFSDEDFEKFVLSEDLLKQAERLQETISQWKKADMYQTADRVLQYLPSSAVIRAKVYPVIKPRRNSFVWEASTNPAIFLYLDPEVSRQKFENTVAHELHHIGLASVESGYDRKIAALSERARAAAEWMGAFGEGFAMLAAAGGPDVDPHAASSAAEHARWDHDMANFDTDLQSVNGFFLDILNGKLSSRDAIDAKASSFFGAQGPWYTVGYKMVVMVEKRFGRPALIETMLDPRRLLVLYNEAAAEQNAAGKEQLPLWSDELLKQVGATS
jgi:hypothetical protein